MHIYTGTVQTRCTPIQVQCRLDAHLQYNCGIGRRLLISKVMTMRCSNFEEYLGSHSHAENCEFMFFLFFKDCYGYPCPNKKTNVPNSYLSGINKENAPRTQLPLDGLQGNRNQLIIGMEGNQLFGTNGANLQKSWNDLSNMSTALTINFIAMFAG